MKKEIKLKELSNTIVKSLLENPDKPVHEIMDELDIYSMNLDDEDLDRAKSLVCELLSRIDVVSMNLDDEDIAHTMSMISLRFHMHDKYNKFEIMDVPHLQARIKDAAKYIKYVKKSNKA
ncbi:hypothetical protein [Methanococcus sp. CF]